MLPGATVRRGNPGNSSNNLQPKKGAAKWSTIFQAWSNGELSAK